MQSDIRAAASTGNPALLKGVGCMFCSRQDVSALDIAEALAGGRVALCGRCRREFRPTALDLVLDCLGMTPAAFAEATGLSLRTVVRATKGDRIGKASSRRLATITGLPASTWRPQ